jgi:hypothetical protein
MESRKMTKTTKIILLVVVIGTALMAIKGSWKEEVALCN